MRPSTPSLLPVLALLTHIHAPQALAQDQGEELPTEEITAVRGGNARELPLTALTIQEAAEALRDVPGGTTLIKEDEFRSGVAANISDVLSLAPSVYAVSRFGGGETRLSIRGSGIRQTFNAIGIQVLRNGLPLSEADTNVRPQLINPLDIRYAEVLPGANGLIYGSATLGGAINFVTATGRDSDPYRLRLLTGDFGMRQAQFSTGHVFDNGSDLYMSYSKLDQDGFRDHATESNTNFYGNYGFRHNRDWETRLHVTRQRADLLLPGSLTKAQIEDDPTQANGFWASRDASRGFEVTRFDLQTTGQLDSDTKVDLGLSIQDLSMNHPLPFGGSGGSITDQERDDFGANVRYQTFTDWFGSENEVYTGVFHGSGTDSSDRFNQSDGVLNRSRKSDSATTSYYFEDRVRMSDSLRLVAGAALVSADRERSTAGSGTSENSYSQVNPKVGFLFDESDTHQYFGSLSRSFEPPTEGNIEDSAGELGAQSAWTLEVGSRGSSGRTTWSGAIYYSQVDDELLTVEVPVGSGLSETSNADNTLHAGVELGVAHDLPCGDDNLHLGGIFNFSKFEFDNDALWGDNAIPGIPQQVLRFDATYEFVNGYYIGLNAQHVASWDVDFANSFEADSFTVYGARAGYNGGKNYNLFVDVHNLTDEKYASNSGIATDVGGADSGLFNPGSPFALFFGIEVSW